MAPAFLRSRVLLLVALGLASVSAPPHIAHASALAARAAKRLVELGVPKTIAQRAAKHVALGMPSRPSRVDTDDYLLARNGYVISYNGKRNGMNWASWLLTAEDITDLERKADPFRRDPTLPEQLYVPNKHDFRLSGFSLGHIVRSRERTSSKRANTKTYVYPNVLPQACNNNLGPWNDFENYYLSKARDEKMSVYLIAGGSDYEHPPVDARNVAVPGYMWKIALLIPAGKTVDDIDAQTRVIAVSMPNDNDKIKVEHDWPRYRISVEALERQRAAALPFFDHLPANVQTALKRKLDSETIPPAEREHRQHNFGEKPGTHVAPKLVIERRGLEGRVRIYSPDKKYGFITGPDGSSIFVRASGRTTTIGDGDTVTFDLAQDEQGRFVALGVRSHSPKATPANVRGPQN